MAQKQNNKFIGYLVDRRDDRGLMADLKRGLNPTTAHRAWPHIAPWCNLTNDREREIYSTIAGGMAVMECRNQDIGTLGATLRFIATQNSGKEGLNTFEAHFRRLMNCRTVQELCQQLPRIFMAARQRGVGINFERLLDDLHKWEMSERVRISWAHDYWGSRNEAEEGDEVSE